MVAKRYASGSGALAADALAAEATMAVATAQRHVEGGSCTEPGGGRSVRILLRRQCGVVEGRDDWVLLHSTTALLLLCLSPLPLHKLSAEPTICVRSADLSCRPDVQEATIPQQRRG